MMIDMALKAQSSPGHLCRLEVTVRHKTGDLCMPTAQSIEILQLSANFASKGEEGEEDVAMSVMQSVLPLLLSAATVHLIYILTEHQILLAWLPGSGQGGHLPGPACG